MIDFKSLKLRVNAIYSFVGIKKQDDIVCFHLPKGFDEKIYELEAFDSKRDLFFLFYKTLTLFKNICIEKGYLEEESELSTQDRDGVIKSAKGSDINNDINGVENIFYSKLDIIGSLLNAYDEPKILALAYRLGRSDKLDISQIHRYLHQAVYLNNNAAYVDQMLLSRQVLQFESTDIITMYCYVFCEIKQQLEEIVSAETMSLAERFRQHYIGSQDSLFQEQSYEQVLGILKDALETIDNNTVIKDVDYWQYYETIEFFLYGDWNQAEDGEIWGIKDFHSVWESMCLTYLVKTVDPASLLYLDDSYISYQVLRRVESFTKIINLSHIFQINGSQLIPDAIVLTSVASRFQDEKTYCIGANTSWNDYGYKTIITGLGLQEPKIAYISQSYEHTLEKLKEFYEIDEWGNIVINAPLPPNFYSFWEIPDQPDAECLYKMKYFNHLFYLALERRIVVWDDLFEKLFLPLGIVFDLPYNSSRANVFTHSLFRGYSASALKEKFDSFIQRVINQYEEFLEIIDIKYLTCDHFLSRNNIEDVKSRSVRKQFVYEHLLQKNLERRNDHFKNLSVRSSFWLPSYDPSNPHCLKEGPTFMDGYIQLKTVNFILLAEIYLQF